MFSAKEAREKQQFATQSRRLSFDEALQVIEDEVVTCASDGSSHMTMTLDVDRTTAKQLKKELKEAGYCGVAFDGYSFGYVVSCRW